MTRRYVVVRTDKNLRPFVLAELEEGRLRQGWGYRPEFDLRLLQKRIADGDILSDEERSAWRNRRLLDTEGDGLRPGDVVVMPNLPDQGRWILARVVGPYRYEISAMASGIGLKDYGHIVAVDPIRGVDGKIGVVEADNAHVNAKLRATMRNLSRMWSIDSFGDAVETLIAAIEGGADTHSVQPEEEKASKFFSGMREHAWKLVNDNYKGAELEDLIRRLFERIYEHGAKDGGRVEHWGGAGEKGADLIVFTADALGIEYKIAVQVKLHSGVHADTHALEQLRHAHQSHRIHAGVVVTTAAETSAGFEAAREAMEADLAITVRVITRDELVVLIMRHLGAEA